jgi:hypothetical protein
MYIMNKPEKELRLNKNETLVLFHILGTLSKNLLEGGIDEKEQQLLWNLESVIEKHFEEVLSKDYQELVEKAKLNLD